MDEEKKEGGKEEKGMRECIFIKYNYSQVSTGVLYGTQMMTMIYKHSYLQW